MQEQIVGYIENFLSPDLSVQKNFNTQQALLTLIQNQKKFLNNKGFGGAVLMDLSKEFDTINRDLGKVKG